MIMNPVPSRAATAARPRSKAARNTYTIQPYDTIGTWYASCHRHSTLPKSHRTDMVGTEHGRHLVPGCSLPYSRTLAGGMHDDIYLVNVVRRDPHGRTTSLVPGTSSSI